MYNFLASTNLMVEKMFSSHHFNKIGDADEQVIKFLKNAPVFLSPSYLKAIEQAAPSGIIFNYVSLLADKKITGFYYFQIIDLSSKELGQIINLEPYHKIVQGLSSLMNHFLFGKKKGKPHYLIVCGNMCASGEFGIYHESNSENDAVNKFPDILKEVIATHEKGGKVAAVIVKDFETAADHFKSSLLKNHFLMMSMDPVMMMQIDKKWLSMPDYLNALSAKYRLRYNNARKKFSALEKRDLSAAEMEISFAEIDNLYKAVQNKSPIQLLKPDANYLIQMSKEMKNDFIFRAFYNDEKMVAFLCGLKSNDQFEAHHIGIDYQFNKSLSLYLNLLYEFIEIAIDKKSTVISFGRTALEMKTTVGAKPVLFNAYLRFNNHLLNKVAKPFISEQQENEWTPRNPFKEMEKQE